MPPHSRSHAHGERRSKRALADFFPEEHIVVTSGIVLFMVGLLAAAPTLASIGRSTQVAYVVQPSAGVSFSFVDALITGMGALAIVFLVVYLTWKYARANKT